MVFVAMTTMHQSISHCADIMHLRMVHFIMCVTSKVDAR